MPAKAPGRWWSILDDEDPITLEPLSLLRCPPFELSIHDEGTSTARRHLFDGHVLAEYIVSQVVLRSSRKQFGLVLELGES